MPEAHCLETKAWKECGGKSKCEGGNEHGLFHCSKEKSHWVLYCHFIDFAFLPSISFLLVAASDYLLKKEKCRNFQIAKGPSRGWWTFPFPSQEKFLFCFVCTYWVSLFICLWFFGFFILGFFCLMYIQHGIFHLPDFLWDVYIRLQEEGRKRKITSKPVYSKTFVKMIIIVPWSLLEEQS